MLQYNEFNSMFVSITSQENVTAKVDIRRAEKYEENDSKLINYK